MSSTSLISCSIVFSKMPPNMCHLPVRRCTDPFGAAYSNVQVYSDEERFVGYRVYIPTCLPVARDEDGVSLLLCFMMCTHKVEDLCIWFYVVIFDSIAMITIFCTVVLSVIQRVSLNTGVLPFSKGRALQYTLCL
jgi:hypothetical protein